MKTINIPYTAAEQIESLGDNTVLISISSDLENKPNLKVSGDNVLKVYFPDVTARIERGGVFHDPMHGDTAMEILAFIKKHLGKNFIVHCHAGVSRSSAICLFMHVIHGYELKENFWAVSSPNTHVIGELIKIKYNLEHLDLTRPK